MEANWSKRARRAAGKAALQLALAALQVAPAAAQLVAPLPLPPPPAPPLPTGGVQRALGGAYGAINAAGLTNPAAAEQANFLYQSALQRYRAGDYAAAAAEANAARGLAGAPVSAPLRPAVSAGQYPAGQYPAGWYAAGQSPAGVLGNGSPQAVQPGAAAQAQTQLGTSATPSHNARPVARYILSDALLRARNEIELAAELDGPQLEEAKRLYRVALDAYLNGDRAKEEREAGASFAQAEQVLEHPPKPTP
jgi:TolA-binding protein